MDQMNWVNLEVGFLSSEVMVEASHEVRSTWLALIAWCVQQENSGRIAGAGTWQDMKWLKLVGAEPEHIKMENKLYWFDGDDLVVAGYPTEQEATYRRKKVICKAANEAKQRKRFASQVAAGVVHNGAIDGTMNGAIDGHRKEKEGNGNVIKRKTKKEYESLIGMEIPSSSQSSSSFYMTLKSNPRYAGKVNVEHKLQQLIQYNTAKNDQSAWKPIDLVAFCENDMRQYE